MRVRDIIHYEGLHFLLWKILTQALSPVGSLELMSFYQKDLTRPMNKIPAKLDLTVCQATESDIEKLAAMLFVDQYRGREDLAPFMSQGIKKKFVGRLRRGHRCFLGLIGTEIVHYNWIFFPGYEQSFLKDRFIDLMDDEVLLNDAYTSESWRGKSVHTVVQNRMLLFLRQQGYRRAYTLVFTNNRSSQKTHHRLGWERSGLMLYFVLPKSLKVWTCCLRGTLDPFVTKQIPSDETRIEVTADDDGEDPLPFSRPRNIMAPSTLSFLMQNEMRGLKSMGLTQRFRMNSRIIFKEEGDGAFLLEPETGNSKYMNHSAKNIFLKLSEEKNVEEVVQHILGRYPGLDPKQIRRDVEYVLFELEKNGFISAVGDTR